jgi:hypothetical protein
MCTAVAHAPPDARQTAGPDVPLPPLPCSNNIARVHPVMQPGQQSACTATYVLDHIPLSAAGAGTPSRMASAQEAAPGVGRKGTLHLTYPRGALLNDGRYRVEYQLNSEPPSCTCHDPGRIQGHSGLYTAAACKPATPGCVASLVGSLTVRPASRVQQGGVPVHTWQNTGAPAQAAIDRGGCRWQTVQHCHQHPCRPAPGPLAGLPSEWTHDKPTGYSMLEGG